MAGEIANVVNRLARDRAIIVPDSVSVSGQTVEATIPVAKLENVQSLLSGANCRVDVAAKRQFVELRSGV